MITSEKAMELLHQDLNDTGSVDIDDLEEAERLGLEALKRLIIRREQLSWKFEPLLPGEAA